MTNPASAQIIGEAMVKLREASDLLNQLVDDPRIGSCVRELEGCGFGWGAPHPDEDDYLYDRVFDLYVEAGGDVPKLAEVGITL
jgi:hypothetical protein